VNKEYDILIIGGGINGAGIAREASMRGYSVCLCEKGDFASGTSSASTKLIHGGLRYLEHNEFLLVRKALIEREVLLAMAPHIIRPMRFVLPHHNGLRPKWLLRLGLFIYDHLGGRKILPATKTLNLKTDETGKCLKNEFETGFEYSDCWVEDTRLTIFNLMDARENGADIKPRTSVEKSNYSDGMWSVSLSNGENVSAKVIINAAGPWVDEVRRSAFGVNNANNIRLVRGSHIVINRKFEHDKAYIFQNSDDRILFAIPYEHDYTLIGTTDAEQEDMSKPPAISEKETDYLCKMASEYFADAVTRKDIVWTYAGVRPLYDDGASKAQEATRDYIIRAEETIGDGTLLNIFGGKITTFRKLAFSALNKIDAIFDKPKTIQKSSGHFPGGDFPIDGFQNLLTTFEKQYPFMEASVLHRLTNLYGTRTVQILDGIKNQRSLGKHFGAGLYACEVNYLMKHEWAACAEDIVFRRTKLGLRMSKKEISELDTWMEKENG